MLAEAADLLSTQLHAHLERLAECLEPRARCLERRFAGELRRRGFSPKQRKALAAVTLGAAADALGSKVPLPAFFEQVEYNGRRLAKLDVPPGAVLQALQAYERLAAAELQRVAPLEYANLQWASDQLNFCVVLTLNNAFYQVREAETQAFYQLVDAELASLTQRELLERCLATLAAFCQADAGRLFLYDRRTGKWLALAAPAGAVPVPEGAPADVLRRVAVPRHIREGSDGQSLLLDPAWRNSYPSCWSIPLRSGDSIAGVMQFGFLRLYEWLPRELQLLTSAGRRALLASEKLRLAEELAAREEQVRQLASNMLKVEERERRRISRELHDEAGQLLLYLRLHLDMIERSRPESPPALRTKVAEARELVGRTVLEIRRIISDLSPAVLEQLGLEAAVRQLVNRFRHHYGIAAELRLGRLGRLAKQTELIVYRLLQECCSNVARHSSASHVNICLSAADSILALRVEDDGVGFQVEQALANQDSFGLAGMRERVALAGGRLELSSRPGHGATIAIELPLPERRETEAPRHGPRRAVAARHAVAKVAVSRS